MACGMEGGRNRMEQYDTATIEKHAFDIAKKRLGDDEGNTTPLGKGIIVEIGRRDGRLDYAKKLREQYDKPKWSLPDEGNTASLEIGGRTRIVEMGRKNGQQVPGYIMIKPPDEPSPLDPAVPLYATDKVPHYNR